MFLLLALSLIFTFHAVHSSDSVNYRVILNKGAYLPALNTQFPNNITYNIVNHADQKTLLTLTAVNKTFKKAFTIELYRNIRYDDPDIGSLASGRVQLRGYIWGPNDEKHGENIALFLQKNHSLRNLTLAKCTFTLSTAVHILDSLTKHSQLRALNLHNIRIKDEEYENQLLFENEEKLESYITSIVNNNPHLTTLNLGSTDLHICDACLLIEALCKHSAITDLSLRECYIETEKDVEYIDMLIQKCPLKKLDLYQSFGPEDLMFSFLDIFPKNSTLTSLDFGGDIMDLNMAKKLRDILDNHPTLTTLYLENINGNNLDVYTRKKVQTLLTSNPTKNVHFSFEQPIIIRKNIY